MSDLTLKIQDLLENPVLSAFSTITTDGKPWVRYVMAHTSENLIIRFPTHITDRKVQQIHLNNEVHLTCGVTDPSVLEPYLQIQGTAILIEEQTIKQKLWNPKMEIAFDGPEDENYGVIEIKPYCIEFCEVGIHNPEILYLK